MEKEQEKRSSKIRAEKSLRLGEVLLERGLINEEQLHLALDIQKAENKMLGDILVEKGFITEEELMQAVAKVYFLPFVDLAKEVIDEKVAKMFSSQKLKNYHIFPLRIVEGRLIVATSDPLDILTLQEIGYASGYTVEAVVATSKQIGTFINKYSGPMEGAAEAIKEITSEMKQEESKKVKEKSLKELKVAIYEAPIVKLVDSIILEAIGQGASDVHFEPQANGLFIRFRIDGVLYEKMTVPQDLQPVVISRVKIVSGMDIAERRKPQDGRLSIEAFGRNFDIRVSTLPGIFGEKVVLRLLDKQNILIPLENLGLDEKELGVFNRLIRHPYGIILITGPTGSGKTTTLYSILNTLNQAPRNIITVEEPVEYELPRIHQTAINVRAGYTFATAIRHILRQDPDIIMVGEIRDLETAEIAIQAAITGHLVLSTLHTNNAAGAVTRLIDMKVEPFLISSAVIGVIAQRLVRRLCPYCKEEYVVSDTLKGSLADLLPSVDEKLVLVKPRGCERCNNLGYAKRTGIFEILTMTDELRELILKKADEAELTKMGISQGMLTLRASGVKKALGKITSLEEVMRVAYLDKD